MMYWFAPDAANWLVARLIDTATAGRSQMPARALEFGILIIVAAFAALGWLGWQWLRHRLEDRNLPAPGNLLASEPWLADRTIEIPAARPQSMRRTHRYPVARHVQAGPVEEWPTIVLPAADPDATVVVSRPHGRWGAQ